MKRYHKNCSGEIINRKCQKCGKVFKIISYYLTKEIEDKQELRFDPEQYRKRIRDRRDLP